MLKSTILHWLTQRYRERWLRWLDTRIPANDTVHMTLDTIFVLPTGFGWSFIIMACCLFLLGTNYQNNLMLILCYLMLAIMLLTLFYSHQNFARLAFKAKRIDGFHCNETGEVVLHVVTHPTHKNKRASGVVKLSWLSPERKGQQKQFPSDTKLIEYALDNEYEHPSQVIDTLRVPISIRSRGRHKLPRLTIACDFPLGLYKCWTHIDLNKWCMVYPKPIEGRVNLLGLSDSNEYNTTTRSNTSADDFYALTDYELGQPLNRVAWKQVAKNGNWVVKQFSTSDSQIQVITIPPSFNTEEAVSILTWHVLALHKQQAVYGLSYRGIDIAPDAGQSHLIKCLEALAVVDNKLTFKSDTTVNKITDTAPTVPQKVKHAKKAAS